MNAYFTCKDTFTIYDEFQCHPAYEDENVMWRFNNVNSLVLTISYKNWSRSTNITWNKEVSQYLLDDNSLLTPISGVSDSKVLISCTILAIIYLVFFLHRFPEKWKRLCGKGKTRYSTAPAGNCPVL